MENRKNIDDFFKKKLEGETFDFDEKYWAGAEALLDEDKRKRRVAFWWWSLNGLLGLALVVAMLGAGVYWLLMDGNESAVAQNANVSTQTMETRTTSNSQSNTNTDTNAIAKETEAITNENNQATKATISRAAQNTNTQKNSTQTISNLNKTTIPNSKNTKIKGNTTPQRSIKDVVENGGAITPVVADDDSNIRSTAGDSNSNTGLVPDLVEGDRGDNLTSETINRLPQRMVALMFGRENRLPVLIPIKPVFNKRWQFGVDIGMAQNRGTATVFNQYHAGLFAQYRLSENLYLRSGASFIQQEIEGATDTLTQIAYGFGNKNVDYYYEDKTAQYIEIPLTIGYSLGKHSFEGGIGLRSLIGVQSDLYESKHVIPENRLADESLAFLSMVEDYYGNDQNSPYANPPVFMRQSLVQSGAREAKGYVSNLAHARFAYQYRLNARLDIGFNLKYRFKNLEALQGETVILNEISKTSVGIHTRIKF